MIDELDTVVLSQDLPEHGLKRGDVGAVVHRYPNESRFEVEFVAAEGRTVAIATLLLDDIGPMSKDEILHVRELATT
jgi:hypothetical protein